MASILFVTWDGGGNVAPALGVAAELRDRVIWTGFLDDQAEVSALYRTSDLLVLPSRYEPWALVVRTFGPPLR